MRERLPKCSAFCWEAISVWVVSVGAMVTGVLLALLALAGCDDSEPCTLEHDAGAGQVDAALVDVDATGPDAHELLPCNVEDPTAPDACPRDGGPFPWERDGGSR